jgi:hypothetical protein
MDRIDLACDLLSVAHLDDSLCLELQKMFDSDNPEAVIAGALLRAKNQLSSYLIGRARQTIPICAFTPDLELKLTQILEQQIHPLGKSDLLRQRVAKQLIAAAELSKSDRDSIEMDIEAGDHLITIIDCIASAKSRLPDAVLNRLNEMFLRGLFGQSGPELEQALEGNATKPIGSTRHVDK